MIYFFTLFSAGTIATLPAIDLIAIVQMWEQNQQREQNFLMTKGFAVKVSGKRFFISHGCIKNVSTCKTGSRFTCKTYECLNFQAVNMRIW